jgi:(p)ppGpp synthase/HD superfamily hydrolase
MSDTNEPDLANFLHLTDRFTRAIDYARQVHVDNRKGTSVPTMAHLLGVASLVRTKAACLACAISKRTSAGRLPK